MPRRTPSERGPATAAPVLELSTVAKGIETAIKHNRRQATQGWSAQGGIAANDEGDGEGVTGWPTDRDVHSGQRCGQMDDVGLPALDSGARLAVS